MDIVGSTSIIKDLDPEDNMAIMDTALRRLANPVYVHGGRITRFMGDGFKALFGAPVARENDPEMGIRAGLQILAEAKVYAREVEAQWHIQDFSVRVGISTGLVIIGGDTEAENTILGSTVNLAARLESAARPGTLLISDHTYQHIRGMFDLQLLEPIMAKGFAAPIQVYRVRRVKPHTFRMSTWSVAGIETRMVGRDAELLMLQNMFRDATEVAEVHIVTVVGDAGVGKSRLLYEFEKWIELLPEEVWYFKGRATPEAETMPYGLIRGIFAHRFEILESDSAAEVREKFRAGMTAVLNSDRADLVGQLLGFDFSASQSVQAQLGSESFGRLATAHLTQYLEAKASEPMVIFLEDIIHWADDSSLDLLYHLLAAIPATRLLVVCLARPRLLERHPNWGEGQEFHPPGMPGHSPGIGLPFDPEQARQLVTEAGYAGGQGFPAVECLSLPERPDLGENLGAQWQENLGVKVNREMMERQAFHAQLGEHMPHLFILGWRADYPDPDNFMRARIGDIQRQKWQNLDYDSLVEQAQRSLDQGERMKLYGEAERILAEEVPIMPIFHRSTRLLVKSWVTRFPTTGLREWFFKDVIIKPH